MKQSDLAHVSWSASQLGDLISALARRAGLVQDVRLAPPPPETLAWHNPQAIGRWIEATADWMGCEAASLPVAYAELEDVLHQAGPAVLLVPGSGEGNAQPRFVGLVSSGRGHLIVIGPDHRLHRIDPKVIQNAICHELEAPFTERLNYVISASGVPENRQDAVRQSLLRAQLGPTTLRVCWMLRDAPSAPFHQQLHRAKIGRRLLTLIGAHTVQYVLFIGSWWLIGLAALQGTLEYGWLIAWALLLASMIPFRMLATWTQGLVAIGTSSLLKQRMLHGAMCLDPDAIRHEGAGHLLSRVIESEAIEQMALSSGFLAVAAIIELSLTAWVLSSGAAGIAMPMLLAGWTVFALALGWVYYRRLRRWTHARLNMTHELVERLTGQRTRMVQEQRDHWHDEEDRAIERYLHVSRAADNSSSLMSTLIPRGWIVLGLAALAPAFLDGTATIAGLAIGIGGILLGAQAFAKLSGSLANLSGAVISWTQIQEMFHASARDRFEHRPMPLTVGQPEGSRGDGANVAEADGLVYRYRDRGSTVVDGCRFALRDGDRVLLEGPSGSGKSTLAAILTGLRRPQSGLLLLRGLDRHTLGRTDWRRLVASAPQFHENHVLTGSFAFNLLMGRRWPAMPEDLAKAETICRELGLGDLLSRMPSGLQQTIGETGWQLSHGERSRLFIARAILQDADVVVLDESFAALDPSTLRECMECVLKRVRTLLVVAHP